MGRNTKVARLSEPLFFNSLLFQPLFSESETRATYFKARFSGAATWAMLFEPLFSLEIIRTDS